MSESEHHQSDTNSDQTTGPMILVACLGLAGFLAVGNMPISDADAHPSASHAQHATEDVGTNSTAEEEFRREAHGTPQQLAEVEEKRADADADVDMDYAAALEAAKAMRVMEAEFAEQPSAAVPTPTVEKSTVTEKATTSTLSPAAPEAAPVAVVPKPSVPAASAVVAAKAAADAETVKPALARPSDVPPAPAVPPKTVAAPAHPSDTAAAKPVLAPAAPVGQ